MKKLISILVTLNLILGQAPQLVVKAADTSVLAVVDDAIYATVGYMLETVKTPKVGQAGGEWAILGLARSGYSVPELYYENYYIEVEKHVVGRNGVLHAVRYTEYSRLVLGLTAAGYDPRDVGGYDLTEALGDFEKTIWQGVNGAIFALLALDSYGYPVPENKAASTQATRDMYVSEILRRQTPDGGWNMTAGSGGVVGANEVADPSVTGMALQALAKYMQRHDVKTAVDKAISLLSNTQDETGGYESWGSSNIENTVQVLVALCELGIPIDDPRFVKNGNTLLDSLLGFKNNDGSFKHAINSDGVSQISSEQALYGLVAASRQLMDANSLYRMTDTLMRTEFMHVAAAGLPGRHNDVSKLLIVSPGKTFDDIKNHPNQLAIEALASLGVLKGKNGSVFAPMDNMTRAEFATIATLALGLPIQINSIFTDVGQDAWYAASVGTAYFYGMMEGKETSRFEPNSAITRQEAAHVLTQAAKLCGMDIMRSETETRDILAKFGDYRTVASWAQSSLAFCFDTGIMDDTEFDIGPGVLVKRGEVAGMIYRMLDLANLL